MNEQNLSHRQAIELRLRTGLDGQSFMSQTGAAPENLFGQQASSPNVMLAS